MKSNYTSIKFKQWLDKLQQESWQLELLISGFAVLGLFNAFFPLRKRLREAGAVDSPYEFFYFVLLIFSSILILNLIIHVILRGIWIGAIGLRYISGEIDYDKLNYSKKFTNYLEKKVGPYDKYVSNLEDLCSIIFALTFIVLFYFLAFFICIIIPGIVIGFLFSPTSEPTYTQEVIGGSIIFTIITGGLIVFIDFITQGGLKKKKWTSTLYFPIYRFFSIITLSFLYRHLVYNFLDNKFGKRILFFLIPAYLLIITISTIENTQSNFFDNYTRSNTNYAYKNNYLNLLEDDDFVRDVAIQSRIVNDTYLKVFIVYNSRIENIILKKNKTLVPEKDSRGMKSKIITIRRAKNKEDLNSLQTEYLNTFKKVYSLMIDDTKIETDFIATKVNDLLGFETILPLKNIPEGKHNLRVTRINFSKKDESEINENIIDIPFWYYKN
ncbi:hypothetical protein ACSIGC_03420 [Tenacibaculum sp. ZS6-P6]|uniref:hypothetical protein n=1 Tax=Tenacibaculum sp. ZS6-P6 TaxID=3447503 RepID=UPI003F9DF98E